MKDKKKSSEKNWLPNKHILCILFRAPEISVSHSLYHLNPGIHSPVKKVLKGKVKIALQGPR